MGNPHVLVIPYPVQGHVLPLMELAQCLAKNGIKVTFVNTELTHKHIMSGLGGRDVFGSNVHLVSIPDGIEPGENRNIPGKLSEAISRVMPGKIEELIKEINNNNSEDGKISCVIVDQSLGWALQVAAKLGLKKAAFIPAAAAMLVLGLSIPKLIDDGLIDQNGTPIKNQTLRLSSNMPLMNTTDFVWTRVGNTDFQKIIFQVMVENNKFTKLADWLICNSTYDLEPGALTLVPHIIPIGPLLASSRLGNAVGYFWPEDSSCLKWLDHQPSHSVIYVAFGSLTVFNQTQFEELAFGLELTNRPFLWVVRPNVTNGENYAYPEGYLERVALRGLMVSWAPQQKVLSHPSIACFVSHCGWNSIIEGVSNGVPFLCWPCFADQFINKSYICEVWKVGLGFKSDEKGVITRSEIKNKVEQLLGNNVLIQTAFDLKGTTMNSIREGGSSYKNFSDFIEWMKA